MNSLVTKRRTTLLWSSIAATIVLCGFWTAIGLMVVPVAMRHDFLVTYTGARMASLGEYSRLHDPALMFQRMREIEPDTPAPPVVRPHFYAFLTSPLAKLPYREAFWVWFGIQVFLLIGCWIWAVRQFGPDALIWGALSVPCGLGIFHGQDCVIMLAIAIGGYALAKSGRPALAGVIFGLGLVKFHLLLFLPLAMLISRRWKMFGGFAAAGTALLAFCLALGGAEGLKNYAALLRNKDLERLNPTPEAMISIQGLLVNLHADNEAMRIALGVSIVIVAGIVLWEQQPLWRWTALSITVSLFIAPHVYGYDAAIMVLPVWLVQAYSKKPYTRIAFAVFATPLPFFIGLAGSFWSMLTPLCLAVCAGSVIWESWATRKDCVELESGIEGDGPAVYQGA